MRTKAQLAQNKRGRKPLVILWLSRGYSVTRSCKEAGISKVLYYRYREQDPEFAKAADDAIEAGTDLIEDELRRRAVDGFEQPVFYKGEEVGRVRLYSDQLLIELMRARRPHKYRPTWNGPNSNGPNSNEPQEVREIKRLIIDAEYSEVKDAPAKPEPVPLVPKGN